MKSSKSETGDKIATAALSQPALVEGRIFESMMQDIQRPLSGALVITDLLQRETLSPEAAAFVATLAEHHSNLLRLVNEASDLSLASRGALSLNLAPTELRAFMDEVQSAWQGKARDAGAALSVSYDGADFSAVTDAPRLRQLFDCLIARALKHTRRGGVEASLMARRTDAGLVMEGRVRDSGVSLMPEKLARIFEPAMSDGAGMGLTLCRHIVEAMNGSIVAENNAGAGATIAFNFIAEETAVTPIENSHHIERAAHVLVVDDNATNRMVAEALCEMFDCTSESVEDGVEAVEAADSGRFDLILMDIKMPRMDGVEATRNIRAMPGRCGVVPIIALTANADPEDAAGYLASGMSMVVEKPIKPEALLAAMNACLPLTTAEAARAAAA